MCAEAEARVWWSSLSASRRAGRVGVQRALETASALNEVSDGGCGGSGRFDAAWWSLYVYICVCVCVLVDRWDEGGEEGWQLFGGGWRKKGGEGLKPGREDSWGVFVWKKRISNWIRRQKLIMCKRYDMNLRRFRRRTESVWSGFWQKWKIKKQNKCFQCIMTLNLRIVVFLCPENEPFQSTWRELVTLHCHVSAD